MLLVPIYRPRFLSVLIVVFSLIECREDAETGIE